MFSNRVMQAALMGIVSFGLTPCGFAQQRADNKLTAELVKNGLYVIRGGGTNSLVRLSANGVIMVDGKESGSYKALKEWVDKIAFDQPVRVLILTNAGTECTGTNANFLAAGTNILAQQNVKAMLNKKGSDGGPTKTYDQKFEVKLGGVEANVLHFGDGFSSGDSVVYFPDLRVVAVGELFSQGAPKPASEAGGSAAGWSKVLTEVLKLDFDVVVPAKGPLVQRAELEAFKRKVDELTEATRR